jgi:hypothetical protein
LGESIGVTAIGMAFAQVYWIWGLIALAALVITVLLLADVPLRKEVDVETVKPRDMAVPGV